MYQNPLRGTRLSKKTPYFFRDRNFALSIEDRSWRKPRHEHIVSNSSSEMLSPSASAMTATMTLAMRFDSKERFMIILTLLYFTMPNIINQHNELRTRNFGFAVSVSSECFINEAHKKQMPN
jgi:hypothetical protein